MRQQAFQGVFAREMGTETPVAKGSPRDRLESPESRPHREGRGVVNRGIE